MQKTRWHSKSGSVSRFFDDLLTPGVRSLDTNRLNCLEPWNLSKLVPYDPSYLAGFKAQRYQVTLKEGFEIAKEKMVSVIRADVRQDIGGDEQQIHSISTDYSQITFKHLLFPIWIASYRYRHKQYQVMVNAQTGKVLGDHPVSVWKISSTVAAVLAAIVVAQTIWANIKNPPTPTPVPTPVEQPLYSPGAPVPASDTYRDAINVAGQAVALTQSAQTRADWEKVKNQWAWAIELLKRVPPSSPNYGVAQQKIQEYQTNYNYARQRMEQL
ncbi:hypothetical protein HC928_18995 [bacterium]|nr:hypothetical protein [bacterium]